MKKTFKELLDDIETELRCFDGRNPSQKTLSQATFVSSLLGMIRIYRQCWDEKENETKECNS